MERNQRPPEFYEQFKDGRELRAYERKEEERKRIERIIAEELGQRLKKVGKEPYFTVGDLLKVSEEVSGQSKQNPSSLSRRDFLKIAAAGLAGLLLGKKLVDEAGNMAESLTWAKLMAEKEPDLLEEMIHVSRDEVSSSLYNQGKSKEEIKKALIEYDKFFQEHERPPTLKEIETMKIGFDPKEVMP